MDAVTRLKLIYSAPTSEPADDRRTRRQRLRELGRIEATLQIARHSYASPPVHYGIVAAGVAAIGLVALYSLLPHTGAAYFRHVTFPWLDLGIIVAAYQIASRRTRFKSWTAKIFALLANYDPADRVAYRELQGTVSRDDLYVDNLVEWLSSERAAVAKCRAAAEWCETTPDPRATFLKPHI